MPEKPALSVFNFRTMRTFLIAAFAATFSFSFCQNPPAPKPTTSVLISGLQDGSISRIWPSELDSLKAANPNIPIVDVRTEIEFHAGHIYRSISCDVTLPEFSGRIVKLGLESPVIIYDDESKRSLEAAEKMRQLGFKKTYELSGGIFSWAAASKVLIATSSKADSATILK